ncbi:MAG: hypothetical protein OEU95_04195 [Nitrospirota bacterium]|nr:hypothetical protein [Nitrospirota bacterium]
MDIDRDIYEKIKEAALASSDPQRAERGLIRFIEQDPGRRLVPYLKIAARLFGASQFLANYCVACPEELYAAIKERDEDITARSLNEAAKKEIAFDGEADVDHVMKALRLFKKQYLLRITLKDITGEAGIRSSMDELTVLAEVIISYALQWALKFNEKRFGSPDNNTIAVIALGKLGGEELNYSSDVDLLAVYQSDEGETTGAPNPAGGIYNRTSVHEFYCKVVETLKKVLSSQTGDGVAYRVDLRLRPQGQKGDIVMPLKAYRIYYESWGRTWERMMLIRARPVAGDMVLGREFINVIEPFVWVKNIGYDEIEEIKGLKKKIDSTFSRDDIKRGYGGIREAEFFVQTFQLLYAGMETSLKSYRILNAIQSLKWMRMIPEEDLTTLWENYLYLRRVEQYLQMKEDLQTHTLPSSDEELDALSRLMGAPSREDFLAELRVRRMQIKSMYNSLLGSREDVYSEALNLLEGGLKDYELTGYLSFRKVKRPEVCVAGLKKIREHMRIFRTTSERAVSRKIIPQLLEEALTAEDPDRALAGIERLLTTYNIKMAHLTAFIEQKELAAGIVKIFSLSPYLTRIFLSSHYYLDILIEEWSIVRGLSVMEEKLGRTSAVGDEEFVTGLARYKRFEEVRFGMLFLLNIMTVEDLFRGLSHLAEAVIRAVLDHYGCTGLSVIALGKLGGREMTFGSDLDIVFVSERPEAMTEAVKILKALTAYTDMGLLYDVDTRLRPDGSKGILVRGLEGYRNYYLNNAHNWEIQALLRARPVGGDETISGAFMDMAKAVVVERGPGTRKDDIMAMRERIVAELSQEAKGLDIKLGPGGIGEIEFLAQYLQLHHAGEFPGILVQGAREAIDRLAENHILDGTARDTLSGAYEYYRKLETFMRLNEVRVLAEDSGVTGLSARFMGHRDAGELLDKIKKLRADILKLSEAAQ